MKRLAGIGVTYLSKRRLKGFWARVKKTNTCWVWTLPESNGYGRIWVNGERLLVHRVSYWLSGKDIPEGFTLDHLCRNRACVNPEHLEPISRGDNVLRGEGVTARHARQTHCKRGHEFNEANTLIIKNGRDCRLCGRIRQKQYMKRKTLKCAK